MAAGMAKGEFTSRINVKGRDEVQQLADSFNTMAGKLENTMATLEDESAKLRGVLGSMSEGVIAVNEEGKIMLVNPQAFGILNIPQQEFVGKSLQEAALPDKLTKAFESCLSEHKMVAEELVTDAAWGQKPGSTVEPGMAAIHIVPMNLGQNDWGAVGVILDVSEAHRLEGMRRRFFSDISHELRTPLTNITGYASALEDGVAENPEERARAIMVIMRESERLQRFIEDILDLSRLESGQPNLQREWMDLGPIAEASKESLEYLAKQNGISVRLDFPRDLPRVFADPDRMSQVFMNLLSNAIRYNSAGGEVIVSASPEQAETVVTIRDTGVGIPEDEIAYVWNRFHRASETARSTAEKSERAELRTNGTGLGLAIVRSIIQAHGGRVWVESEPGDGSVFGFALPKE